MSTRNEAWETLELATEMARRGELFALATVVWRQGPSSGHQGARAIITASGEIHGWIGGACAEPVVIGEAKRAISDGEPRLILLGTRDAFGEMPEGMLVVPMSCQSEGAMEVYIEPVIPAPKLVAVGGSPMASTLVDLAGVLGWTADLVAANELDANQLGPFSVVIVATQGHGDEEALEAAVRSEAGFIGLVASSKRAAAVLGYLADRGVPADALARVKSPVGLDLGHTSHREIAVSVLAELVQLRAGGELFVTAPPAKEAIAEPAAAIDLVCGMTVPADESSRPFEYEGTTYYFCCPGCRVAFSKDPESFIAEGANAD